MFLTLTVVALLSGAPCTLTGRVELTRDGKQIDPGGRVAVYVETPEKLTTDERALFTGVVTKEPRSILQTGLQFQPQVLVLLKGNSVQFTNDDKDEHNVFSNDAVPKFDFPPSRQGVTGKPVTFLQEGPARIQCNIHDWMRSDILVVGNPFFTLAEPDGSFKISGLPVGDYTLVAWEPNGATTRSKVKKCSPVGVVALAEAKPPKLRRMDGGMYKIYKR